MKNKFIHSDEEFLEAVKISYNIHQLLMNLNLTPNGANYSVVKQRAKILGIDLSILKRDESLKRQNITVEQIKTACERAKSRQKTLSSLELNYSSGSNIRWIDNQIINLNIDISHWTGQSYLKGLSHNWNKKIPLNEILVQNSSYKSSNSLRKRLIKESIFEEKCQICGISSWMNQKISLELDHINGDHFDNRLENLRILCPNCHSQTPTHCRAKSSFDKFIGPLLPDDSIKSKEYTRIKSNKIKNTNPNWRTDPKPHLRKVQRPTKEELEKLIWEKPTTKIAAEFSVSDKAIESWCKYYNIPKPPRGYWRKLKSNLETKD